MAGLRQNNNMNKGRVTITGPSPMVQQMAQQNYAMKNGGELPMQGAPGGASTPVKSEPFFLTRLAEVKHLSMSV